MTKPTPTHGGAWRVVNGALIDESVAGIPIEQVPTPVYASPEVRTGGPGLPVPPADQPTRAARRRKHKS